MVLYGKLGQKELRIFYCQLIDLTRFYKDDGWPHECPTAPLVILWYADTLHV